MILLSVVALAVAIAEPPIGSRLGSRRQLATAVQDERSVVAAHKLAACMYSKERAHVRATLAAKTAEQGMRELERSYPKGTCINLYSVNDFADEQQISAPFYIMRGILAETVLREEKLGRELEPLPPKRDYAFPWFAATGRPTEVDEMTSCIAETNPDGIRTLLATTPASPDEARAIARLSSTIGSCLAAGARLIGNRQSLRAGFAEHCINVRLPSSRLSRRRAEQNDA